MPFADDVRKYTFASLDSIITKKGERLEKHPYIPTEEQLRAMDKFVDAMDIMEAGEKDEDGFVNPLPFFYLKLITYTSNRQPWFDTRMSYNPSVHRTKQALFHCAVVPDILTHPIPPPHPELLKYFDPPKRVLKRAREPLDECISLFKVKEGAYVHCMSIHACPSQLRFF
jgi:ATP-dependent DNA helicase 2 subunit 2